MIKPLMLSLALLSVAHVQAASLSFSAPVATVDDPLGLFNDLLGFSINVGDAFIASYFADEPVTSPTNSFSGPYTDLGGVGGEYALYYPSEHSISLSNGENSIGASDFTGARFFSSAPEATYVYNDIVNAGQSEAADVWFLINNGVVTRASLDGGVLNVVSYGVELGFFVFGDSDWIASTDFFSCGCVTR